MSIESENEQIFLAELILGACPTVIYNICILYYGDVLVKSG